jgi:CheY-like chemotaxis protein
LLEEVEKGSPVLPGPGALLRAGDAPRPLKGKWLRNFLRGNHVQAAANSPQTKKAEPRLFPGHRILLVEDNAVNQKVGVRMLEKLGCRVDVAANGFEAVQMVSQLPYDLVFMDCQMPEMDGFQASRQIRSLGGAAKRVVIVALTAAATPADREQCLGAGMNDYLTKPVTIQALAGALEQWSKKDNASAEAELATRP